MKYFLKLNQDFLVEDRLEAETDSDAKKALSAGFTEVTEDEFHESLKSSYFYDGNPASYILDPYRYFVSLDDNKYITGCYVATNLTDLDNYLKMDITEIPESAYKVIGQYSRLVDGEVVQGEPFEPVLSKEANEAIKNARISNASQKISILTDLTDADLVDEVKADDVALLKKWRLYRIALTKVDTSKPVWPDMPE